jgi:hypothetical protein
MADSRRGQLYGFLKRTVRARQSAAAAASAERQRGKAYEPNQWTMPRLTVPLQFGFRKAIVSGWFEAKLERDCIALPAWGTIPCEEVLRPILSPRVPLSGLRSMQPL